MINKLRLPIQFEKVEEISDDDNRFTKVKIYILHLGQNLNETVFEKSVVDKAIPTLEYIPIVGFIEYDSDKSEKDFSDHRYILTMDENGLRRKYLGSAYGVILSSEENNAHYENRLDDNGIERTYLVCEGIIWNMFEDSSNIINRDVIKKQSMELREDDVEGYEDDDGIFHFTNFSFRASCILGDSHTPAMNGSTLEVNFTVNDFIKNIQEEIKNNYTIFTSLKEKSDGGNTKMANKKTDYGQTVMELFSDVSTIVNQFESITDRWGDTYPRYYLQDIQDDEAIVVDRQNNYQYYGFKFSINGDKPEIDFASCKRKKTCYVDYNENDVVPEGAFNFGEHIAKIEETAYAKVTDAESKLETVEKEKADAEVEYTKVKDEFETVNAKLQEIEPKYNEYVEAEHQKQIDEVNAQKDAKFKEFEAVLSDVTEYTELKKDRDNLSVEEIENKCAVMYFKKQAQSNFSNKNDGATTTRIFSDNNGGDNGNYVSTSRYGNIKVER